MSIGTGIFLAAILLSITIIFTVTRHNWNWKKITAYLIAAPIALAAALLASTFAYQYISSLPTKMNRFQDVSLGASKDDVLFIKGEPAKRENDSRWTYKNNDLYSENVQSETVIKFKDGHVQYILHVPYLEPKINDRIFGISKGTKIDEITEKLGTHSEMNANSDGTARLYTYEKYNLFFGLSKGSVDIYGIYDSKLGPLKLSKQE